MKQIYFLHIPKTGGTTLISYLRKQFDESELQPFYGTWNHTLGNLSRKQRLPWKKVLQDYPLVHGHYGLGALHEMQANPDIITMLREPVERTVSQFDHIMHDKTFNNWVGRIYYETGSNEIKDVMADPNRAKYYTDTQARYLALDINVKRKLLFDKMEDVYTWYFDSSEEFVDHNKSDAELLKLASKTLEKCRFYGVQDYFDESLLLLAREFRWKPAKRYEFKMKGGSEKTKTTSSLRKNIEKINTVDRQLYDKAKKHIEKEYLKLTKEFLGYTKGLSKLTTKQRQELYNQLYNKLYN